MDFSKIHPDGSDQVVKDWTDLRDRPYTASLAVLKSAVVPERTMLRPADSLACEFGFGTRNQGRTGRCTGYALAALVDLQRCHQALRDGSPKACDGEIVSADMLYWMGAFHDQYAVRGDGPDSGNGSGNGAPPPEGLRSLRSVIKGFYHHGVCFDMPTPCEEEEAAKRWRSRCYQPPAAGSSEPRFPTVLQAKAARGIGLGAYYRVAPILNDFHAAINEVGGILVSANVHKGWWKATEGTIPHEQSMIGTHAFVLVGYDDHGFLVLNSWGPQWGGYQRKDGGRPIAGVARWAYADWAENIVDAWVLRLGVSAPSAFDKTIGEQGALRVYGQTRSRTPPCFELIGHFMHLDDGRHVTHGAYPSFPDVWQKTADYLAAEFARAEAGNKKTDAGDKKTEAGDKRAKAGVKKAQAGDDKSEACDDEGYRGVLVWIPGSLEDIKTAFELAALRKNHIKTLHLYPYSVFWCARFVDKSVEVLGTVFRSCKEQAGDDQRHLDLVIEDSIGGIGRAFWRDLEHGAAEAVLTSAHGDRKAAIGPAGNVLLDIVELCELTGAELHFVVEGAGALVLHEILANWNALVAMRRQDGVADVKAGELDLERHIATLSLVMPAIGIDQARKHILKLVRKMNSGKGLPALPVPAFDPVTQRTGDVAAGTEPLPARIYVPDARLEERVGFSSYGKSILHLVANAFMERRPVPREDAGEAADEPSIGRPREEPQVLLGMNAARTRSGRGTQTAFSLIGDISDPRFQSGRVPQTAMSSDPAIPAEIFRTIRTLSTKNA